MTDTDTQKRALRVIKMSEAFQAFLTDSLADGTLDHLIEECTQEEKSDLDILCLALGSSLEVFVEMENEKLSDEE